MWGGNGKDYSWSMGHCRLVALLVFQATLAFSSVYAQWSANDSYRLGQIYLQLGGDYNSSHSIHSDLSSILSLQRDVVNVSSNIYDLLDTFFDGFRDVLSPDGQGGYDAVNVDFNLDGYYPYVHKGVSYDPRVHAELLVTNRAETYWLEKIYNKLTLVQGSSLSQFPFAIRSQWWEPNWEDMVQYYETEDIATYLDGQWLYGDWQTFPFLFFSLLHLDDLPADLQSFIRTFLARYGGESYDGYVDANGFYISQAYQQQYGTYLLQNMATNTFLSGLDVYNFFTNGFSFSEYSTNAFQLVADSSGINTNEMYIGSYGSDTNSDVFADIVTNGVELLEGNKLYSSLGEDVSSSFFSNKVSRFDFRDFKDKVRPFLDDIQSSGNWVVYFGNVNLGDFSFTIPSITVERNQTYLSFIDNFLNVLKALISIAFFITLWHQLGKSLEGV